MLIPVLVVSVLLCQSPPTPDVEDAPQSAPALPTRAIAGRVVPRADYVSPYQWTFPTPVAEFLFDRDSERNDPKLQSSTLFAQWYSVATKERFKGWGPMPRSFDCPTQVNDWSIAKKRERVVAAAMMHVGLEYQHHHIPAWDPPRDWPFIKCPVGHQTVGLDCSNFTSWVYNWALGIHLNSAVGAQATGQRPKSLGGTAIHRRIERGDDCAAFMAKLCAGDLLYICDKPGGKLAHVIMWTGECAKSSDGKQLVIDSTGQGHIDSNGIAIPTGVHLRPFGAATGEYWPSLSHALRFIGE